MDGFGELVEREEVEPGDMQLPVIKQIASGLIETRGRTARTAEESGQTTLLAHEAQ